MWAIEGQSELFEDAFQPTYLGVYDLTHWYPYKFHLRNSVPANDLPEQKDNTTASGFASVDINSITVAFGKIQIVSAALPLSSANTLKAIWLEFRRDKKNSVSHATDSADKVLVMVRTPDIDMNNTEPKKIVFNISIYRG